MGSTYESNTQLILLACFIHYCGYFIILILDSMDYPRKIMMRYDLSIF